MASAAWQPVLSRDDAERAAGVIDEIASALSGLAADPTVRDEAALTDGLPGRALFFAYLHRARPHHGHDATARRMLDAAVRESATVSGSPALFGGITGLAWVVQHLAAIARPDHLAALDDIQAAMHAALEGPLGATNVELMSGLVGLGVLAMERGQASSARSTLERLVLWLDASAERTSQGLSWRTPPEALHPTSRARFPLGCHYPGVAHGTAGVAGLLASLLALGIAPGTTRRLLSGAVTWIRAQELPGHMSLFPYQVNADDRMPASRTAWCTGGAGISMVLWRSGRAAGEGEWQSGAVALARDAATRPIDEMGVNDACLCHGAAGLGQLYARWYNETADEFFRDESALWFRRALEYQRPDEGIAGYSAVNAPMNRRDAAPGLLFGAAGIGLALIAATTDVTPSWDRALLMSGPA